MNSLAIQETGQQSIEDIYYREAVNHSAILGKERGIYRIAEAASEAVEDIENSYLLERGPEHSETQLSENMGFFQEVMDRAMNACNLDEEKATASDRIANAQMLIDSMTEYKARLQKCQS